jgi:hypothetical protein
MTINPILSQWDKNGQAPQASSQTEMGRWLRETEDTKKTPESRLQRWWLPVAVAVSSLFWLVVAGLG